jgi:hypothetical protein
VPGCARWSLCPEKKLESIARARSESWKPRKVQVDLKESMSELKADNSLSGRKKLQGEEDRDDVRREFGDEIVEVFRCKDPEATATAGHGAEDGAQAPWMKRVCRQHQRHRIQHKRA